MTDATHNDLNAKVRATIDDAIADLLMLGISSRSEAAALMAIQSIIRIDDPAVLDTVADFADEMRDAGEDDTEAE